MIATAGSASGRRSLRHWCGVAAAHPAAGAPGRPGVTADPADLVRAALDHARRRTWDDLRRDCAAGAWIAAGVDPAAAAWLDDGSFSRWVLGALPDLDDLRDAASELLVPTMAACVDEVLTVWQLEGWRP